MYDRDALLAAVDLRALADDLLGHRSGTGRSPMWPCPNDPARPERTHSARQHLHQPPRRATVALPRLR